MLYLTIAITAVTFALSGVAGFAAWHFNKKLFALFPPPPPRENRGFISAIIDGIFDGVAKFFETFASVMLSICYSGLIAAGIIIAAVNLPFWAIIPVGLALATLPMTIICGIVIGLSHFGAVFQAIGAWLYRVAARFTGFVGAMLDSIALLFTNWPAFFARIAAVSERAGDNVRRAILHDHA
jgi:hypothetical protein